MHIHVLWCRPQAHLDRKICLTCNNYDDLKNIIGPQIFNSHHHLLLESHPQIPYSCWLLTFPRS